MLKTGATFADEVRRLAPTDRYDFFIHFKRADVAGEDGDFQAKICRPGGDLISYIDVLHALQADVFMVSGDH